MLVYPPQEILPVTLRGCFCLHLPSFSVWVRYSAVEYTPHIINISLTKINYRLSIKTLQQATTSIKAKTPENPAIQVTQQPAPAYEP